MTPTARPEPKDLQPLEAIQTFCLSCRCADDIGGVIDCRATACPLHQYRTGKYPQPSKGKNR